MKRRVRFITSVAALVSAVTFMVAGVYAAASREVAITGTISFSSSNVEATITVYQSNSATFTLPDSNIAIVGTDLVFEIGGNQDGRDVSLTPALSDTVTKYTFVVKVQGNFPAESGSDIDIALVAPALPDGTSSWLALTHTGSATAPTGVASGTIATSTNIAGNGLYYYTFTYTANPEVAPASATGLSFNTSVTLVRGNA